MSVLLRHPACVPALFSRAVEPDPRREAAPAMLQRLARATSLVLALGVVLIEVPLVKAAAAAAALALPR